MITLAIETSTPRGSLAVHDGAAMVLEEHFAADRGTGATLFPLLESALERVPLIQQIAVGLGPGSYAGIRIAIAASMGLSMAKEVPLVGIPSVAALLEEHYVVIGDARRDTFYWTEVEAGECLVGPLLVSQADLRSYLPTVAVPLFSTDPLPMAPHALPAQPLAAIVAQLAAQNRGIVMRGALEPIYLREPHITQPRQS